MAALLVICTFSKASDDDFDNDVNDDFSEKLETIEEEKELNTQSEREKMISTIRKRLKPKASSSSTGQDSNRS